MTLAKLKEKSNIDGAINQVNVLFPDQFGRIHGVKVDAEYFINSVQSDPDYKIQFSHNPFANDICGEAIKISPAEEEETEESKNENNEDEKLEELIPSTL